MTALTKSPIGKRGAADGEFEAGVIRLADDERDQRGKEGLGEFGDHAAERGADDDADGHIHNISAQDEFLEAV